MSSCEHCRECGKARTSEWERWWGLYCNKCWNGFDRKIAEVISAVGATPR